MIPNRPPPEWRPHPADDVIIVRNIAGLDHGIQFAQGSRPPFTLKLPKLWHTEMHAGCAHVPVPHYVGYYRGEPLMYLENNVQYGGGAYTGAPAAEVAARLAALEAAVQRTLATFDAVILTSDDATPSRLNKVLEELARHYAALIRIRPFVDGNGRPLGSSQTAMLGNPFRSLGEPSRFRASSVGTFGHDDDGGGWQGS